MICLQLCMITLAEPSASQLQNLYPGSAAFRLQGTCTLHAAQPHLLVDEHLPMGLTGSVGANALHIEAFAAVSPGGPFLC